MDTITIAGREFKVERIEGKYTQYILVGKRGAVYGAIRNVTTGILFLANLAGVPRVDPMGPVRLSDDDGSLRVL